MSPSPEEPAAPRRIAARPFQLVIPIPDASSFTAVLPRPMTESQWDFLMGVLAAMKPGMVAE